MDKVIAYTDGGSRGNPGSAAAGFVLSDAAGRQLQANAFYIGTATNNVAEYTGVIKALEAALKIAAKEITVFSDSELLVRQINRKYKVKSELLLPLFEQAVKLLGGFESWKVVHITRDKNTRADLLVNQAMDLKRDVVSKPAVVKSQSSIKKPIRLGVLISGGGRTLMNIAECINKGTLNAKVALVISSRCDVAGVERAKAAAMNVKIIRKKDFAGVDEFSESIENELNNAKVDLVIQAGWLCLWKIPENYTNRVMNIHPALLPGFGGKGMFGHHVHEAVLAAGCKVSGCTVHFCTNEYDKGPIVIQRCCEVKDDDDSDILAARVFEQECIAYPQAIKLFAENKLLVQNGKVKIKKQN